MIKRTMLLLIFVGLVVACDDSGPSSPDMPKAVAEVLPVPVVEEVPVVPSVPTTPTAEEQIGLVKSSVTEEVDCVKGVRFYAEASGATYFNIHLGGLNVGDILGPNDINEWSEWYSLDPGKYTYSIAAEKKVDGKIVQCDFHNQTFEIPKCIVPPECPKGARIDLKIIESRGLGQTVLVDGCPSFVRWSYEATPTPYNMGVKITAPSECTATSPTTGTCKTPVLQYTQVRTVNAVGIFDDMECARASAFISIEGCTECRACEDYKVNVFQQENGNVFVGDAPSGMYFLIDGRRSSGGEIVELDPDCDEVASTEIELYDSSCSRTILCDSWKFSKEGPPCYECDMGSLTEGCYMGNVSTKQHFFDKFGICMKRSHRTGAQKRSCTPAKWSADAVVVKGGPQFRLYTNVTKGDKLCTYCPSGMSGADCKRPDISHISYFVCDESAVCR